MLSITPGIAKHFAHDPPTKRPPPPSARHYIPLEVPQESLPKWLAPSPKLELQRVAPQDADRPPAAFLDELFFGASSEGGLIVRGERSRHNIFQTVGLESSDLERKLAEIDR